MHPGLCDTPSHQAWIFPKQIRYKITLENYLKYFKFCILLEILWWCCFFFFLSVFLSSRPLTFPSVPSVFCVGVMGLGCPTSFCTHQKPGWDVSSLTFLESSIAFPIERGKTACWLSTYVLFVFLGQTFVFLTPLEFAFWSPPEYLIPSQGVNSFPKQFSNKSCLSSLSWVVQSHSGGMTSSDQWPTQDWPCSFLSCWLLFSWSYLPWAFSWEILIP